MVFCYLMIRTWFYVRPMLLPNVEFHLPKCGFLQLFQILILFLLLWEGIGPFGNCWRDRGTDIIVCSMYSWLTVRSSCDLWVVCQWRICCLDSFVVCQLNLNMFCFPLLRLLKILDLKWQRIATSTFQGQNMNAFCLVSLLCVYVIL